MNGFKVALVVMALTECNWGTRTSWTADAPDDPAELDALADYGWHLPDLTGRLAPA